MLYDTILTNIKMQNGEYQDVDLEKVCKAMSFKDFIDLLAKDKQSVKEKILLSYYAKTRKGEK